MEALTKSEEEPSLSDVVQRWLERTPGLSSDFDFASKYKEAVDIILNETLDEIEQETNATKKQYLMSNYRKKKEQFESIFDQDVHAALVKRGERRFTHKALLGALMIVSYWYIFKNFSNQFLIKFFYKIVAKSQGSTSQTNC